MTRNLQLKALAAVVVTLLALFFLAPTLFEKTPDWWPNTFDKKLRLGLDLQGGMFLILGVNVHEAVEQRLEELRSDIQDKVRKAKIAHDQLKIAVKRDKEGNVTSSSLSIRVIRPGDLSRLKKLIYEVAAKDLTLARQVTQKEGILITFHLDNNTVGKITERAVEQSVETLRNRIDQFGVAEPDITRHGGTQILVQLPGVKDPEAAKRLIGRAAKLEFHLVNKDASRTNVPGDSKMYPFVDKAKGKIVLYRKILMTGQHITAAKVSFGEGNAIVVSLKFDAVGTRRFGKITSENVGRRLAIVLDGKVYTAPVIKDAITSGDAIIEGIDNIDEAKLIAIALRAGSLPVTVHIEQEKTVGPSLGQDSIKAGKISILVGGIFVLLFMVVYFRMAGLVANFALVLNIVIIMAVLALLQATLTLPGIAGIVLTIGMAVDANVLIFERIREEMRAGRTPRAAVDTGYGRATLTILDANVTTLIAAAVLYQFGTGPIKGFAVTLSIGVMASMFTAILVTRIVFDFVLAKWQPKALSI